ncbi:hypothetical protein [Brevundimonas variabilis]|uniref:Divalent metal cation (Fe/Co/Zn/Cd) transporter n=1 Tax=Brevundimonas variabilis TaxID=74312 RepID=A0A7W9CG00_9CAUL|nr:hypothetical protein [Brevundimonas variabilis]MBB5744969.1 divalent metal cation (Fe/Co/Zn/Cd) transporter [Brevundimonas variabilis]
MLLVLAGLVALKAFALGASGSVSALAAVVTSCLAMVAAGTNLLMPRWRAMLPTVDDDVAEAIERLVQSGMAMSAAMIVGVIALVGIFEPRPVGGGWWAVGAIGVSLGITAALAAARARTGGPAGRDAQSSSDLVSTFVVLLGVTAGALLNAPGLDAAAALVVAVWLFWGALPQIMVAARLLGRD